MAKFEVKILTPGAREVTETVEADYYQHDEHLVTFFRVYGDHRDQVATFRTGQVQMVKLIQQ